MTRPFGYGPIPPGWTPIRLRAAVFRRKEAGRPDWPLLSVNLPSGVVLRREGDGRPAPAEDLSGYQVVRRGDLVMNQLGKPHGALGVSDHDGIISPAYFVAQIGPAAVPRFMHHLLRTRLYISEYERRGKFMPPSQFDISWDQFRSIEVVLPPISEQRAIADFLDAEAARIDALIAKKRRLVELIHERFRSYVDAVTAQGSPVRVRHLTSLITSGPRGWADRVGSDGEPFIRSANLRRDSIDLRLDNMLRVDSAPTAEALRSRVQARDILVGITGANTGWVALAPPTVTPAYVSQHVAILRPANVDPNWLALSLFSRRTQEALMAGQYGGTKQQLGLAELAEITVFVPSLEDQRTLVHALERGRALTEESGRRLGDQINLLVERRQALITAAVTGELAVQGVVA